MGLTVSRETVKHNQSLGVKIDKFQPLVVKKVNRRSFPLKNKGKKITYGYKMAKILTVCSKSHYTIEILCLKILFGLDYMQIHSS